MPDLVLGPMLRYVSATEATVWVHTSDACRVTILGETVSTFCAHGRHFAIVPITGLPAGASCPYEVDLDGERHWPPPDSAFPPSRIRLLPLSGPVDVAFGSCRLTAPNTPPYTLSPDEDERGVGVDALYALALRLRGQDPERWPHALLLLGDQVYADEVSPETLQFIRARRDVSTPPGEQVADFTEYAELYREAWSVPALRWLFSVVPTAMIFDDHDVHDDWNTSQAWRETIHAQPWWQARITGALASYWIYQHLGNLSPEELERDPLLREVRSAQDAGPLLDALPGGEAQDGGGSRWSFARDIGGSRLVVLDGREGRVLSGSRRKMFDEPEWRWIEAQVSGDFDHLLLANTLPVLLEPALHYFEAWNEAVCAGAWGRTAARLSERLRQGLDLEHWAAFQDSFRRLIELVREVGSGERRAAPASIVLLGGDVHHAYLSEVAFRRSAGMRSRVYQAVCSPFRNQLKGRQRGVLSLGRRLPPVRWLMRGLARAVGVTDPEVRWRLIQEPTFENQLGTLRLDGRQAWLTIERTEPGDDRRPELRVSLARRLV